MMMNLSFVARLALLVFMRAYDSIVRSFVEEEKERGPVRVMLLGTL